MSIRVRRSSSSTPTQQVSAHSDASKIFSYYRLSQIVQFAEINVICRQLRVLHLDFCGLTNFSKLPFLPELTNLSVIGNSITNLSGLRVLPRLEHISLKFNPIKVDRVMLLAAIGSVEMKTVDDEPVLEEEMKNASMMSPIVGIALRMGRDLGYSGDAEREKATSLSFLTKSPPLSPTNVGSGSILRIPVEGGLKFKWFASDVGESEWKDLDCNTRSIAISEEVKYRIIRCDVEFDGKDLQFYTPDPIGWEHGKCHIYQIPTYEICGSPVPGQYLSLMYNSYYDHRISWKIGEEVVSSDLILQIPQNSAGKRLEIALIPISSVYPDLEFSPLIVSMDIQSPPRPDLLSVDFDQEIVEEKEFHINYRVYPENSVFSIEICSSDDASVIGDVIHVFQSNEFCFVPGNELVGRYVRFLISGVKSPMTLGPFLVQRKPLQLKFAEIFGPGRVEALHLLHYSFDDRVDSVSVSWFSEKDGEYVSLGCTDYFVKPGIQFMGSKLVARIQIDGNQGSFDIVSDFTLSEPFSDQRSNIILYIGEEVDMGEYGQWTMYNSSTSAGFELIQTSNVFVPQDIHLDSFIRFNSPNIDVIFEKPRYGSFVPEVPYVNDVLFLPYDDIQADWYKISGDTTKLICSGRSCRLYHEDRGSIIRMVSQELDLVQESVKKVKARTVYEGEIINAEDVFRDLCESVTFHRFDFDNKEWIQICDQHSYRITKEDVGAVIRIISPHSFADIGPVRSTKKVKHHIRLQWNHNGEIEIRGGLSETKGILIDYLWKIQSSGQFALIEGYHKKTLTPHESMLCSTVIGGYSYMGNEYWSKNTVTITSAIPIPDSVLVTNEDTLVCETRTVEGYVPIISWRRWDGQGFINTGIDNSDVYHISKEDVGCYICCDIKLRDCRGYYGPVLTVQTQGEILESVSVTINGFPRVGETLSVSVTGSLNDRWDFRWEYLDKATWKTHYNGPHLYLSTMLQGKMLRCVCDDDNQLFVSDSVGPVSESDVQYDPIQSIIDSGTFKFKGRDKSGSHWIFEATRSAFFAKARPHAWSSVEFGPSPGSERKIWIKLGSTQEIVFVPYLIGEMPSDAYTARERCLIVLSLFKSSQKTKTTR